MFNATGLTKGLSFIKIIGGLSKTLQIANQIIPIYQKARPAIANAKSMLNSLKEFNSKKATKVIDERPDSTDSNEEVIIKKEKTPTAPTFFL